MCVERKKGRGRKEVRERGRELGGERERQTLTPAAEQNIQFPKRSHRFRDGGLALAHYATNVHELAYSTLLLLSDSIQRPQSHSSCSLVD